MNKWTGCGRIRSQPRIAEAQNGKLRVSFQLSVPRLRDDGEAGAGQDFIWIVAWGQVAKDVRDFATAGDLIAVEGPLQTSSWGQPKQYRTEVKAETVEFLDRREPVNVQKMEVI